MTILTPGERIANQIESYLQEPNPRVALAKDIDAAIAAALASGTQQGGEHAD